MREAVERKEKESRMTDKIKVFTHSSIRIESRVGNIYLDPFRMEEAPHDAAYILITHDHYDHFSPEDIQKVVSLMKESKRPFIYVGGGAVISGAFREVR